MKINLSSAEGGAFGYHPEMGCYPDLYSHLFGMKALALKTAVGLLAAFAAYYTFFLGSVFYELYGPNARWCATPQVWALQGAALFFAPPAVLGSVGLWFIGRRRDTLGAVLQKLSRVVLVLLLLCAGINLLIFIPAL